MKRFGQKSYNEWLTKLNTELEKEDFYNPNEGDFAIETLTKVLEKEGYELLNVCYIEDDEYEVTYIGKNDNCYPCLSINLNLNDVKGSFVPTPLTKADAKELLEMD